VLTCFLLHFLLLFLLCYFLHYFCFVTEEGAVELREGVNKRGRNPDRDRDSVNRSKRRRGSHSQSTEESVGNEQDDDVVDVGVSKIRSPNNPTSFSSDQTHRRVFTPSKPPPFKITDEMIGVTVPRKARSGCDDISALYFPFTLSFWCLPELTFTFTFPHPLFALF